MANPLLTAIWEPGKGARYVWYGADWPVFQSKWRQLASDGLSLRCLDVADSDAGESWSGVWQAGNIAQELAGGLDIQALRDRNHEFESRGLRLAAVRSHGRRGRQWAGIWRADVPAAILLGPFGWDEFWNAWLAQHAAGNRLVDFDTYDVDGTRLWTGLWRPGGGDQYFWAGATWNELSGKHAELQRAGYRVAALRSYRAGPGRLWAAVWASSPPTAAVVADLTESEFWEQWEAQGRNGMRLSYVHSWPGSGYAATSATSVTSARIRMHLKVLANPTVPISHMIDRMREVYEPAGIQVELWSTEPLNVPELIDIDIGTCSRSVVTEEQQRLYAMRDGAGQSDIVVYFVRSTNPPFNGCAAHPDGRPGAVIASYASEWTLAHEVGHVLGLAHVADPRRLMTSLGTAAIVDAPPDLTTVEVDTMLASQLTTRL